MCIRDRDRSISPENIHSPIKIDREKGQGKKRRLYIAKHRLDESAPLTNYNAGIFPPISKRIIALYKNKKRSLSVRNRLCNDNQQGTPQSKSLAEKRLIMRRNIAKHFSTQDDIKSVIKLDKRLSDAKETLEGVKNPNRKDIAKKEITPVSYTHLTLPTICSV
eukprot:TRINITY_DN13737_c0_g1_i1.p1 TRINITY_DN13737_c0_g1~~TRINITY_DN13737_c0_g1_i1.p1  ORF type:complete len:163 (-),score=17.46 TRINITY_DN13737_c0_g1_i1:46-534(-)